MKPDDDQNAAEKKTRVVSDLHASALVVVGAVLLAAETILAAERRRTHVCVMVSCAKAGDMHSPQALPT